jgi:hypothetical protein
MSGKRKFRRTAGGGSGTAAARDTELGRGWTGGRQGQPQRRRKHKRALAPDEIAAFLSCLAETCNVSEAAREVGRPTRIFYDLRRREPAFRAEWSEALRDGYDMLEMEMVHRARFGAPRDVFHKGRKTATTRVFNDSTALKLLHLHRKSIEQMRAADGADRRDAKGIFDELAARVAEIRAENAAKAEESAGDDE